jgi:hypothetical protein
MLSVMVLRAMVKIGRHHSGPDREFLAIAGQRCRKKSRKVAAMQRRFEPAMIEPQQ